MTTGDIQQRPHIHGTTKQVDGNNGATAGGNGGLKADDIEVEGVDINIHKNGRSPHGTDHLCGGNKGEGGGDRLVPGANVEGAEGEIEGIGTGVTCHTVVSADGAAKGFGKGLNNGAVDILARCQHLRHRRIHLGLD